MNKQDQFINWLCGKGKYPFFQDKCPCEDTKVKSELTFEERIEHQAVPDQLMDTEITNYNEPFLNK